MATAEEKLKKWVDFFTEAGIKDPNKIDTFAKKFSSEEIDDDVIQNLTDKDLEDFGVKAKGDRLRIIKCIQGKNEIELAVDLATSVTIEERFAELEDEVNQLKLRLGFINIGEAAADMLITKKKPKSARNSPTSSKSPQSSSSSPSPTKSKPPPPLTERERFDLEIFRDFRDDLVHQMRDSREEGVTILEQEVESVIKCASNLSKRKKLKIDDVARVEKLKKIKLNF